MFLMFAFSSDGQHVHILPMWSCVTYLVSKDGYNVRDYYSLQDFGSVSEVAIIRTKYNKNVVSS